MLKKRPADLSPIRGEKGDTRGENADKTMHDTWFPRTAPCATQLELGKSDSAHWRIEKTLLYRHCVGGAGFPIF
jgi:hypothetical protein